MSPQEETNTAAREEATMQRAFAEEYRSQAHRMVDFIADYYRDLETFPVMSAVQPGYLRQLLPPSPPNTGESLESVLSDVSSSIIPGITHWQSPSFFAYYPANTSPPAMLADMLSSAINAIGFNWIASPAETELESLVLDWLAQLLQLPPGFHASKSGGRGGGVIQGTASEAVLVALLAARQAKIDEEMKGGGRAGGEGRVGEGDASEDRRDGVVSRGSAKPASASALQQPSTSPASDSDSAVVAGVPREARQQMEITSRLTAYTSDQAHSCVLKATRVAGIPECNVRFIATSPEDNYSLSPAALRSAVEADVAAGLLPFFLCATVGTTSSAAVDPLAELTPITKSHGLWLHVDAAYAGSACICPEHQHHLAGLEGCQSFAFNAHKWLLTNFDCSCMFVQESAALRNALSTQAVFLKNKASDAGAVIDYKDWQIPLGRRFRALKLWFVLRLYGADRLRAHIRRHVSLAERFEALVRQDSRFEVVAPRAFSLVCFRLRPSAYRSRGSVELPHEEASPEAAVNGPAAAHDEEGEDEEVRANRMNKQLMDALNATGKMFLTQTMLSGKFTLRMAIGGTSTELPHIESAWRLVLEEASKLLQ